MVKNTSIANLGTDFLNTLRFVQHKNPVTRQTGGDTGYQSIFLDMQLCGVAIVYPVSALH